MPSRAEIRRMLESFGYPLETRTSRYDRFAAPSGGSLYVKEDYLSATGPSKVMLEQRVPRSTSDPKDCPEWRGPSLQSILVVLRELSSGKPVLMPDPAIGVTPQPPAPTSGEPLVGADAGKIPWDATGVYIAYPTSAILRPIYRGYTTKVNNQHTKVGIAQDSFSARRRSYLGTFDGEVTFTPIAEIPAGDLPAAESKILAAIGARFQRVERAQEWFATDDRQTIVEITLRALA